MEHYYSEGTEVKGNWGGKAAEKLGLSGEVNEADYVALCENRHPGTDERLTQRNRDGRRVGWDFTFSPPKSVSVVHALSKDDRIVEAFRNSVQETMREAEQDA